MSDSLGDGGGYPTESQIRLYESWAKPRAPLCLIGASDQGIRAIAEKPANLVLGPEQQ